MNESINQSMKLLGYRNNGLLGPLRCYFNQYEKKCFQRYKPLRERERKGERERKREEKKNEKREKKERERKRERERKKKEKKKKREKKEKK